MRELAALPIRRQKLVQDNQAPLQPEQRIDRLDSRRELVVFSEAVQHAHGETPFQFRRNLHRRVQQKIRDQLGRVIPAKVLEVQKYDLTAAPPKSVVKMVESANRISPARSSFGGIQMKQLNSVLPAAVNGCGRSRSTA